MSLEQTEQSNTVTNTPASVLVFQMLPEQDAICVLRIIGKLLVEKVARHVIAMKLEQEVNNVIR